MNLRQKFYNFIFTFTAGTLYTFALCQSVVSATELQMDDARLFSYCALSVLFFLLFFFNRITFFIFLGLIASGALYLFFSLRASQFSAPWVQAYAERIIDAVRFIQGYQPFREEFGFLCMGLAAIVAFFTVLSTWVRFYFSPLLILGLCIFAIPAYLDSPLSDRPLILFLFSILVFLSRRLSLTPLTADNKKHPAFPGFTFVVFPLSFLLLSIAFHIPKPETPITTLPESGVLFSGYLQTIEDMFYETFHPKYFSFQSTGFSGRDSRLGGRVIPSDRYVMEVFSDRSVYLSGAVKDTYTGSSWTLSGESRARLVPDESGWYLLNSDAHELAGAFAAFMESDAYAALQVRLARERQESASQPDSEHAAGIGESPPLLPETVERLLSIHIGNNRSQTLFHPPFASSMWISEENAQVSQNTAGDLTSGILLPRYTDYAFQYLWWDYQDESFIAFLKDRMANTAPDPALSAELAEFLTTPSDLPGRVSDLARELTAEISHPYDKMKMLEQYLAAFPYTLEPNDVPEDADFVDYFLFTGKEGYCTYYASALAVMGRCIGIPTRYVEGYVMPKDLNAAGRYTVTNFYAHAWTEAYFEGFGWVPFEATAPYTYAFYNEALPERSDLFSENMLISDDYDDLFIYFGYQDEDEATESAGSPEDNASDLFMPDISLFAFIWTMLALFTIFCTVRAVLYHLRHRKLFALSGRKAAISWFSLVLKAAETLGYPMEKNETAYAYAARTAKWIHFDHPTLTMDLLAGIFSRASYSLEAVTGEDVAFMQTAYHALLKNLWGKPAGRPLYLWRRFVLWRF